MKNLNHARIDELERWRQRLGRATVLNVHEAVVLLDPQGNDRTKL